MPDNSINKQIQRIKQSISNAYTVLENSDYEIPYVKNVDNLDDNMSLLSEGVKIVDVGITKEIEVDENEYLVIELAKISGGEDISQSKLCQEKTYTITEEDLNGNTITIKPDDDYLGMSKVTIDLSELLRILSEN